jgi:hypothetical protein
MSKIVLSIRDAIWTTYVILNFLPTILKIVKKEKEVKWI